MKYPRIAINYPCFRRSSFFGAIHTTKAVRFLLNLENQTMSDSLKIELHVKQLRYHSEKIELHAQTATLCMLKIEFHAKTTTLSRLKIEMHVGQAHACVTATVIATQGKRIKFVTDA